MTRYQRASSTTAASRRYSQRYGREPSLEAETETQKPGSVSPSLVIGAKTLAGIGIGLLAVTGGALVIGAVTEAVIIPSLLLKLAGGLTGGGIGMAKGLKGNRPQRERE